VSAVLAGCLYVFAVCAALGLVPAALLAARAGQRTTTVTVLVIAAFVIWVLVNAAGNLR